MALSCTNAEAISGGACFVEARLGSHNQKALETYLWVLILDSFLDSTYVSDPDGYYALATCYAKGMTDDQLYAAMIGVLNVGMSTGVTPPAVAKTKTALTGSNVGEAIKCYHLFNDRQLMEMKAYAICNIFGILGY